MPKLQNLIKNTFFTGSTPHPTLQRKKYRAKFACVGGAWGVQHGAKGKSERAGLIFYL